MKKDFKMLKNIKREKAEVIVKKLQVISKTVSKFKLINFKELSI